MVKLKRIGITPRIHMEEDGGKPVHSGNIYSDSKSLTLIQATVQVFLFLKSYLNPDICSGAEARAYVEKLPILQYLGII